MSDYDARTFIGKGDIEGSGPWQRQGFEPIFNDDEPGHPARYSADDGLIQAVNTALILGRPLLLTGRPGTGKSELAERIAWEFNLAPVLRFEAQSLTEAKDLFYSFDLVAQMADAQLARSTGEVPDPKRYLTFGALGRAILYANPAENPDLVDIDSSNERTLDGASPVAESTSPSPIGKIYGPLEKRQSVVLIDEIDKAARDVPNDLLNGIERMAFRIRELRNHLVAAPVDPAYRPIVIITSNSERDLPEPFLRRCVYYHIPDPDRTKLAEILHLRVPGARRGDGTSTAELPTLEKLAPLYQSLLNFFAEYRAPNAHLAYQPGTAEMLDWATALDRQSGVQREGNLADNAPLVIRTLSTILKNQADRDTLFKRLKGIGIDIATQPA